MDLQCPAHNSASLWCVCVHADVHAESTLPVYEADGGYLGVFGFQRPFDSEAPSLYSLPDPIERFGARRNPWDCCVQIKGSSWKRQRRSTRSVWQEGTCVGLRRMNDSSNTRNHCCTERALFTRWRHEVCKLLNLLMQQ